MRSPFAAIAVSGLLSAGVAAQGIPATPDVRRELAPTGTLRVGLYVGNPSSLVKEPVAGEATGIAFELGRELARWLGVPFEPVIYPNNGAVLEGFRSGNVDIVFTNATPARAKEIDFTQAYLEVEAGFLAGPRSPIGAMPDVDKPGVRVGAMEGSTSLTSLPQLLKHASVVPVPTIDRVIEMFGNGSLDVFATNKSILFEISDTVVGSRVLDGRYGVEQLALGIPKNRARGLEYARRFIAATLANGRVQAAVTRAGFRGGVVKTGA
ncbi:MAG TPA: transporter substrate-binding domain-containing protein [Vicinamibacterales bacterium]|nr:transporter substrate-binding domain-containing protein [Vicinamibacterales bacterium]